MTRLNFFFAVLVCQTLSLSPVFAFAPTPGGKGQNPMMTLLPMIGVFLFIFYFIVMRPQQKEQKRHRDRLEAIKKGDRIVTAGGIHGTVRTPKEKTVIVEIAEGVKITLNKTAVATVLDEVEGKSKAGKASEEPDEDESE